VHYNSWIPPPFHVIEDCHRTTSRLFCVADALSWILHLLGPAHSVDLRRCLRLLPITCSIFNFTKLTSAFAPAASSSFRWSYCRLPKRTCSRLNPSKSGNPLIAAFPPIYWPLFFSQAPRWVHSFAEPLRQSPAAEKVRQLLPFAATS